MSSVTSVSVAIGSSVGTACGSAPRGPEATIDGKLGSLAPRRRISCSSARATSRSLRPTIPHSRSQS